jgi:hypothetical protein
MRRLFFIFLMMGIMLLNGRSSEARQGFSVGFGPMGNIFLIDTQPTLDPGIGGYAFFNYRFQEQFAFETKFLLTTQDGTGTSEGDNGILLLGMPTFDLKFYLLKNDPRFDPYLATGLGLYWLTEGSDSNDSGGIGLGAQIGVGFDFYVTDTISTGFEGVFRSIGMITDLDTPSSSTAIFPYSLMGNVAFHF